MNEKLGIQDLIDLLARKHEMARKDAEAFVKEFFQLIEESLETDKYVKIKGLGTFKLISVDSRESVKVMTGERFQIQGHTKVSFTPEPALRDIINRPFSHFETVVLNENTVFDDMPIDREEEEEEKPEETFEKPTETVEENKEPLDEPKQALEEAKEPVEERHMEVEAVQPSTVAPEVVVSEEPVKKEGASMRWFMGVAVFIALLCIGAIAFLYYPDLLEGRETQPIAGNRSVVESKQAEKPAITLADTLVVPAKTTTEELKPIVEAQKPVAKAVKPAPKQLIPKKDAPMPADNGRKFKPDSTSYKIVGTEFTYKLGKGEMLTKVALRFYGTKALWPYLVEHNRDIIKNPNSVPSGITLKIPRLEKKQ